MKAVFLPFLLITHFLGLAQYYPLNEADYQETFDSISSPAMWPAGFDGPACREWAEVSASSGGSIPDGSKITVSSNSFSTGSTAGIQRGDGNLVFLAAGSVNNTAAVAVDLLLNLQNRGNALLSFDWVAVANATGDRCSSLRVYVSSDGDTFEELTGAAVTNICNNTVAGGSVSMASFPLSAANRDSVRLRFYVYNGTGGSTGSRAKIALDNLLISTEPYVPCTPGTVSNLRGISADGGAKVLWSASDCGELTLLACSRGAPVAFTPSGNGELYQADTVFGNGSPLDDHTYCVLMGAEEVCEVTGLTNEETYYFTAFTLQDTIWSEGVTISIVPEIPPDKARLNSHTRNLIIDFDNHVHGVNNGIFGGAGMLAEPGPGQLDSDSWMFIGFSDGNSQFGASYVGGDFARGTSDGNSTTAGLYAMKVSEGNHALGVQATGTDFTPGSIVLKLENESGLLIDRILISFLLYFNDNGGRKSSWNFLWSLNGSEFTPVSELSWSSPAGADTSLINWKANLCHAALEELGWPANSPLYLKWAADDLSGSGSRDEFALDDIRIAASPEEVTMVHQGTHHAVLNSGPVLLTGELTCDSLLNGPGALLEIGPGGALVVSSLLQNEGFIDLANNASLVGEEGLVQQGEGNYKVRRDKPPGQPDDFYNLWSSPVVGGNTDMIHGGYSFYKFNPGGSSTEDYMPYQGALAPGEGFACRGADSALFTGTVNNGDILIATGCIDAEAGCSNLIGNPYPSSINAAAFVAGNAESHLKSAAVYLWSQVNTQFLSSAADFIAVGEFGSSDYNRNENLQVTEIASGQGFFVEVTQPGSVKFSNSMRTARNDGFKSVDEAPRFWLRLLGGNKYSSALVALPQDALSDFSYATDVPRTKGESFSISVRKGAEELCISAFPESALSGYIPVTVTCPHPAEFEIGIPRKEYISQGKILLSDRETGMTVNLLEGAYKFRIDSAGTYTQRFYLGSLPDGVPEPFPGAVPGAEVQFELKDDLLLLSIPEPCEVLVADLAGRILFSKYTRENVLRVPVPEAGLYILTVNNGITASRQLIFRP